MSSSEAIIGQTSRTPSNVDEDVDEDVVAYESLTKVVI